jgi:hypothetical protein
MEHSNTQVYFLRISKKGKDWIVGTNTQRGFTSAGVHKALEQVRTRLPAGWTVEVVHAHPLSSLF